MIAIRCFVRSGLGALILGLGCAATAGAQEIAAPNSPEAIRGDIAHVRPVALSMVVRESTGPLTKENIHEQISRVVGEYVRQGADFSLGSFSPKPVVVLYEDPTGKKDVKMAVGLLVPRQAAGAKSVAPVKPPLKFLPVDLKNAVRHLHTGPHEELGEAYHAIEKELQAGTPKRRAGWPVVMQVLDDPTRVDAKELRVVLNVPVE